MSDMPKYVLKNKRLNKNKTVFIFRRNYLDIDDFEKTDDGWIFEERFTHYGKQCWFRMVVHSDNIFSMYETDCKTAKVKGNKHCFGVFLRTEKQNGKIRLQHMCGSVEFILHCDGKQIAYDNGKGIRKTMEERRQKKRIVTYQESRMAIEVPRSVLWSIRHPFQGGGMSPR